MSDWLNTVADWFSVPGMSADEANRHTGDYLRSLAGKAGGKVGEAVEPFLPAGIRDVLPYVVQPSATESLEAAGVKGESGGGPSYISGMSPEETVASEKRTDELIERGSRKMAGRKIGQLAGEIVGDPTNLAALGISIAEPALAPVVSGAFTAQLGGSAIEEAQKGNWGSAAANAAMGALTAGHAVGGVKAAAGRLAADKALSELGIQFERPTRWTVNKYGESVPLTDPETGFTPAKEDQFTTKGKMRSVVTGQEYTLETRSPGADKAVKNLQKNPQAMEAFTDMGDFIDSVAKAGSEELVGRIGTAREAAGMDPALSDLYGETGNFRGYSFGGGEHGHTYIDKGAGRSTSASAGQAFYMNPYNIANSAKGAAKWLLETQVDPTLLARATQDLSPSLTEYVMKVRAGGPRVPELDLKLETEIFRQKLVYTALHESTGHTIGDTGHAQKAPEYKSKTYGLRGEAFEGGPRQVGLNEGLEQTGFEPAHNAITTALKDPAQLQQLKALMEGPTFQQRLTEWYKAASGDAPGLSDVVAKRTDRVVGRAEAKEAVREQLDQPAEQPPTPPDSVPPGAEAEPQPQGPQLPPLAERIKLAMRDQIKSSESAEMARHDIRTQQADAIRELEAKFQNREISLDDFEAGKARVLSGTMDLVNRVNGMAITPVEKQAMIERIISQGGDDAFLRNRLHQSFNKLVDGQRLQDAEFGELRDFLSLKTGDLKRTGFEKAKEFFSEATGGVRAWRTAWDLSAWRQGLYAIPMNPTAFAKAVRAQIQSLSMSTSEFETFMRRLRDIETNPYARVAEAAKLHFSETMEKGSPLTREEAFSSGKWAQALPGVRRSEQAYIAFLNKLRVEVFNKHVMQLVDSGTPIFDANGGVTQQVKDIAYMVNTLTGRGELSVLHISPDSPMGRKLKLDETWALGKSKMDQMHTGLTSAFFAPRFQASRFAMMRDASMALVGGNLHPTVYRMYMKNMFGTVAAITSAMYALEAAGAGTFERDPRKKDFGVIKAGKVRYDGYGSLKQWARLFAQMGEDRLYGHAKGPKGSKHQSWEKTKDLARFGQSKLSPLASLAVSAVTGEDFIGRPNEAGQLVRSVALPMIIETAYDVVKEGEADQLGAAIPAAVFGVGVNAYSDKRKR